MGFIDEQVTALAASGWVRCDAVARTVQRAGLEPVSAASLVERVDVGEWAAAEVAVEALRERFDDARFAHEVQWGVVLVPDPARLDTRGAMAPEVRAGQLGQASEDVVDPRLGDGALTVAHGQDWTLVATVTGRYAPALGSWDDIASGPAERFEVAGVDTRAAMTRQVWGARVLQAGADVPDCERNDHWTFTVFAGEPLTEGLAASGTVLKGRVRFRLGKADRAIASVRAAPGVVIAASSRSGRA